MRRLAVEEPLFERRILVPGRLGGFALMLLFGVALVVGGAMAQSDGGSTGLRFWLGAIALGGLFVRAVVLGERMKRREVLVTVTKATVTVATLNVATGQIWERDETERAEIAAAVFLADGARGEVALLDGEGKRLLMVPVDTHESADDLIRSLALDPAEKRTTYEGVAPIGAGALVAAGGGALAVGLGAMIGGLGPWLLFGLLAVAIFVFAAKSRISLAKDGVLVQTILGARFVAFRDVLAIATGEGYAAAWLFLKDGSSVPVPALSRFHGGRDPLLARLRSAFDAHRAGQGDAPATAVSVARGTRSTEQWIDDLRGLRRRDDYRTAAVTEETLLAVLEDVSATEDARAGAALALVGDAGDEVRKRIRVAAEATASPRLRVALKAAARSDEAGAERALTELAEEDVASSHEARRRSR